LASAPDWWKLEPAADSETWANIERAIITNDPHCRGVVLLGLSSPQEELVQSFAPAARVDIVKGFAVGRTIFNDAAARWFKGEIDDEAAIEALSSNLGVLVEAWRARQESAYEIEMSTLRLTAAQAAVRYLANQFVEADGGEAPYFAGVWAIFGHGNVAGMGEALYARARDVLPTYRAHNEQAMAHAAIAYAKQLRRRRAMMACTTSIGPGATNMVTAAALAHVNRLPVLLVPGDVFANRVRRTRCCSRSRISATRPFHRQRLLPPGLALFRSHHASGAAADGAAARDGDVLTDPADCGPVTLAFLPQDVQTMAWDYPRGVLSRRRRGVRGGGNQRASELEAGWRRCINERRGAR
jgi:hypothetical protein